MPQVEQLNDDEITLIIGKIRPDFQAYKFTTTDINTPSIYPQSPKQSIISHISRKISLVNQLADNPPSDIERDEIIPDIE